MIEDVHAKAQAITERLARVALGLESMATSELSAAKSLLLMHGAMAPSVQAARTRSERLADEIEADIEPSADDILQAARIVQERNPDALRRFKTRSVEGDLPAAELDRVAALRAECGLPWHSSRAELDAALASLSVTADATIADVLRAQVKRREVRIGELEAQVRGLEAKQRGREAEAAPPAPTLTDAPGLRLVEREERDPEKPLPEALIHRKVDPNEPRPPRPIVKRRDQW